MRKIKRINEKELPENEYGLPKVFVPILEDGYHDYYDHPDFFRLIQRESKEDGVLLMKTRGLYDYKEHPEAEPIKFPKSQLFFWNISFPSKLFVISFAFDEKQQALMYQQQKYTTFEKFLTEHIPKEFWIKESDTHPLPKRYIRVMRGTPSPTSNSSNISTTESKKFFTRAVTVNNNSTINPSKLNIYNSKGGSHAAHQAKRKATEKPIAASIVSSEGITATLINSRI